MLFFDWEGLAHWRLKLLLARPLTYSVHRFCDRHFFVRYCFIFSFADFLDLLLSTVKNLLETFEFPKKLIVSVADFPGHDDTQTIDNAFGFCVLLTRRIVVLEERRSANPFILDYFHRVAFRSFLARLTLVFYGEFICFTIIRIFFRL